jgi:beta-N-acetylhexosaminidase
MGMAQGAQALPAIRAMCGQLVIGGFETASVTPTFAAALRRGERGGAILFTRNLTPDPMHCAELSRVIAEAAPTDSPPLVSIDQEGGRVQRLKAPVLPLPPMRTFGDRGDAGLALAHDAAKALAMQLAALGITMPFAPVLDVNTCEKNPVIGDRAFGTDPRVVLAYGRAWATGLREGGVLSCGKHFPGHGDTSKDSHFDLPVVELDEDALVTTHVAPFLGAPYDALMTAHVVYTALDPETPATLSSRVLDLARARASSFAGCLVSDDLEMKAIADRWPIEESAVRAIAAGCDALLICRSEELQDRAVDAMAKRASEDAAFAARVREARDRFMAMRRRAAPKPVTTRAAFDAASEAARAIEGKL